jgi:cytoskeletal protein CcmA (bactofilin family)
VDGDITAPDIIMESGCSFNGICKMKSPGGDHEDGPALNEPETSGELNNEE